MMFLFICYHFVVGREIKWNIPMRESCEGGEGGRLKKLTSLLISGLRVLFFVGLFIWMSFATTPEKFYLFLILDGSSRI